MSSRVKRNRTKARDRSCRKAATGDPVSHVGAGSRHLPEYEDTQAKYVSVRRSDLEALSTLGWLQEGCGAAGTFFLSGGFWVFLPLLVDHWSNLGDHKTGLLVSGLSVLFGIILIWIAHSHLQIRRNKITEIVGTKHGG